MFYEKLVLLTVSQREKLEDIQRIVKNNGGNVSANQLIRDSLDIFLDNYDDIAVKKYSSSFSE